MSRAPVQRRAGRPRRLACGHRVHAGTAITRKPGGSWLCPACQPWLPRYATAAEVVAGHQAQADARQASDGHGETP